VALVLTYWDWCFFKSNKTREKRDLCITGPQKWFQELESIRNDGSS